MTTTVLTLVSAVDQIPSSVLLELTLRATDATPANIILYPRPLPIAPNPVVIILTADGISDSWPTLDQVTGGVYWYENGVKRVGAASTGDAIYPVEADVKDGVVYGPEGNDFTGVYDPTADDVYPVDTDVRLGVHYGPTGADHTGTLIVSVGGTKVANRVAAYKPK